MSILARRRAERIMPPPEPPDLEERVRDGLRRADAVPHEGRLPRWLPDPYGPDLIVFGPRYTLPDGDLGGTGA